MFVLLRREISWLCKLVPALLVATKICHQNLVKGELKIAMIAVLYDFIVLFVFSDCRPVGNQSEPCYFFNSSQISATRTVSL